MSPPGAAADAQTAAQPGGESSSDPAAEPPSEGTIGAAEPVAESLGGGQGAAGAEVGPVAMAMP